MMKNLQLLAILGITVLLHNVASFPALVEDENSVESEDDGENSEDEGSADARERLTAPADESTYSGSNAVMKTQFGVLDGKSVEKSYNRWREIVIRVFLFAGKGKFGHGAGIFTALLVEIFKGPEKSPWEKLESKIDTKLRKEFTKEKMDNLKDDFRLMKLKIAKGNGLTMDDLDYIVSKASDIFPQDHSTTTFSGSYVSVIRTYMFFLSSAYLNIMAQKKLDQCAFARELRKMRPDMINAAKKLYQMRFQQLEGNKYWNGQLRDSGKTFVRFFDKITNIKHDSYILETKQKTFSNAIGGATKKLVKLFMEDYNDLIDPKTHEDICKDVLPDAISDNDMTFAYPTTCYGSRDGGGECALPCEYYGSGSKWCFDDRIFKEKDDKWHERREGYGYIGTSKKRGIWYSGQWDWCKKPSFDECMPVDETTHSNLLAERMEFNGKPAEP